MSETLSTAELTTRDVLLQVDRRLTLIEGDLRGLDGKLDDKIDGLRGEMTGQINGLHGEFGSLRSETHARFERTNTRIDEVYTKLDVKIDSKFYQLVGILLVTWISTIVTVLLK